MIKLAIGDVVVLKSGSPTMTVFEFKEELVETVWMNGLIPVRDTFHFKELVQIITKDIEFEE